MHMLALLAVTKIMSILDIMVVVLAGAVFVAAVKKHTCTSIWSEQHPNTGQNIQYLWTMYVTERSQSWSRDVRLHGGFEI